MKTKVALIADNHFIFANTGEVFVNGTYTRQYLSRFTSNFDRVVVVCRGRQERESDQLSSYKLSGGTNIEYSVLPDFRGVLQYLKIKHRLKKIISKTISECDAVLIRMPCILTTLSLDCAKKYKKPIIIDVGADPESIYKQNKFNLIRSFVSIYLKSVCKRACIKANGVSYVTNYVLQQKYPCYATVHGETIDHFTASISNVDIPEDFFYDSRKYNLTPTSRVNLLHVSNYIPKNSGKGHLECIDILRILVENGIDAYISFLGDGDGVDELKSKAKQYGIYDRVAFVGRITDKEIYRNVLINHDLFLFPSHSEGLPRVLIEAMSTGMVCLSSNVDGIPELLDDFFMFDYSDCKGFSNRIIEIIKNVDIAKKASKDNYKKALAFSNASLKKTYDEYYGKVVNFITTGKNK